LDPLRFFHCTPLQVEIVRLLDGNNSPEEIAEALQRRFRADISVEKVSAFIESLDRRFLLEPESTDNLPRDVRVGASKRALARWRRQRLLELARRTDPPDASEAEAVRAAAEWLVKQDPSEAARRLAGALALRPSSERLQRAREVLRSAVLEAAPKSKPPGPMFPLFDPYPLLAWLHGRVRFAFTSGFLIALAVLAALSLTITIANRDHFKELFAAHHWTTVRSVSGLVIFTFMLLVHELGHGVACVHYGGRPRRIGIILILWVMPAAFCDVTDSVLFDGRRPKVVTFLAGVVATTAIWCIATPLWWLTKPGTALNEVLLLTSVVTGISNIVELLPLYKFDGHFVLAALAGHQNLFEESWEYFRSEMLDPFLQRHREGFGRRLAAAGAMNLVLAPLLVGCLVCGKQVVVALSAFCLFGIFDLFIHAGLRSAPSPESYDLLKRKFAVYALAYYVVWMIGLARVLWGTLVPALEGFGALLTFYLVGRACLRLTRLVFRSRAQSGGSARRLAPWVPAVALWAAADLALLALIPSDLGANGEARIAALEPHPVRAELGGLLLNAAREGERVEAGQVIARLESPELASHLERQAARSRRCRAAPMLSEGGPRGGGRGAGARDRCEAVEEELRSLERAVQRLAIRAPASGVVATSRAEEKLGSWMDAGEELLEIADPSALGAEVLLDPEEPLAEVRVGQPARLYPRTAAAEPIDGRLVSIAPALDRGRMVARIALLNPPRWLRANATGRAHIFGTPQPLLFQIARPWLAFIHIELWRVL
jgi:hypothetical protein